MKPILPSLTLVRRLAAPPGRVFDAWTDPALVAQWFGPQRTHVDQAELDLRVGGEFRIALVEDDEVRTGKGTKHVACGRYLAIEAPKLLKFSWWWASSAERVSQVTVTLRAIAGGTELTLLHEQLPDIATAARHTRGWTEALDRLVALAAA